MSALSLTDYGKRTRAHVDLSDPDDRHVLQSAEGEGPVAAVFAALAQATGVDFELESYEVHSMGIGRDARGEANLSGRIDGEALTRARHQPRRAGGQRDRLAGYRQPRAAGAPGRVPPGRRPPVGAARGGRMMATQAPTTLFDKLWDAHVVTPETDGHAGDAVYRPAPDP